MEKRSRYLQATRQTGQIKNKKIKRLSLVTFSSILSGAYRHTQKYCPGIIYFLMGGGGEERVGGERGRQERQKERERD